MQRVVVVGASGSGKSTLGARFAKRLGVELVDLDELFHLPDWRPRPTPEFRALVAARLAELGDRGWVIAGNYSVVSDLTQGTADTIVWLDLPRWLSTARVVRRSLRRVVCGERLWNGNRERLRNLVSRDPERNIVVWAWQSQPTLAHRYAGFASGRFWSHADVIRLTTSAEVRRFLDSMQPDGAEPDSS